MPAYDYKCPVHGVFEIYQSMENSGGSRPCPECGRQSNRLYTKPPVHYHCDGFFSTDHFKGDLRPGDKRERLNRAFEQAGFGKPPPPDPTVDRNRPPQVWNTEEN